MKRRVLLSIFLITVGWANILSAEKQHGIAMHNDLKYRKDFQHFNGVNPQAPKGGTIKFGVVGTFDCTNPYLTKGTAPVGLSIFSERLVFESLMARSPDEPFSLYGCL